MCIRILIKAGIFRPALDPHEEEERQTDVVRAFLLGIALHLCYIDEEHAYRDASVKRWMFDDKFSKKGAQSIRVSGELIGTGYAELMQAFSYNSAMVESVKAYEKIIRNADIGNCARKEYKDLKQHRILYSMTHTNEGKEEFDTENILLSIFKYYVESSDDNKLTILLDNLGEYIDGYASEVTEHDKLESKKFYASIVDACAKSFESVYKGLAASSTKGKPFTKLSDTEQFIRKSKTLIEAFRKRYTNRVIKRDWDISFSVMPSSSDTV